MDDNLLDFYIEMEDDLILGNDFHIKFTLSIMSKKDILRFVKFLITTNPNINNADYIITRYLEHEIAKEERRKNGDSKILQVGGELNSKQGTARVGSNASSQESLAGESISQ